MRTIIRLQRHGPMNAFFYKLIAQGSYKKLRGMYIEQLGFWFPQKINQHGRAVVLNKSRIRYWLAVGAVLSPKMQRFLSFADMAPEPWTKFGRATTYKDPVKNDSLALKGIAANWDEFRRFKGPDKLYERSKIVDNENIELRRIKFQQRIKDYLDIEKRDELVEQVLTESDREPENASVFVRTQKFRLIKQFYEELAVRAPTLSPLKRELMHRKLNQLAEEGLLGDSEFETEKVRLASSAQQTIDQGLWKKFEDRKQTLQKTIDYFEGLMAPISEADFIRLAKTKDTGFKGDFDSRVAKYIKLLKASGQTLSLLDVERFGAIDRLVKKPKGKPQSPTNPNLKFNTVSRYPITPLPRLEEYDPNDWYDLTEFRGNKIKNTVDRNDQWFNIPLTEAQRNKKDIDRTLFWMNTFKTQYHLEKASVTSKLSGRSRKTSPKHYKEWKNRTHEYLKRQRVRRAKKARTAEKSG